MAWEPFEVKEYTWPIDTENYLRVVMETYGCTRLHQAVLKMRKKIPFKLKVLIVWDGERYYIAKVLEVREI